MKPNRMWNDNAAPKGSFNEGLRLSQFIHIHVVNVFVIESRRTTSVITLIAVRILDLIGGLAPIS